MMQGVAYLARDLKFESISLQRPSLQRTVLALGFDGPLRAVLPRKCDGVHIPCPPIAVRYSTRL